MPPAAASTCHRLVAFKNAEAVPRTNPRWRHEPDEGFAREEPDGRSEAMSVDLTAGVPIESLPEGAAISGKVGDDEIVVVRTGGRFFAVGAHCTHYHGALADGLVVGGTIRCPLHHACFDLATGEAVRAPALDPTGCWRVQRKGDSLVVREKLRRRAPAVMTNRSRHPESIVIVGGGAAGLAAACPRRLPAAVDLVGGGRPRPAAQGIPAPCQRAPDFTVHARSGFPARRSEAGPR